MSRGIYDIEWYGKKYILEWFKEDGLIQITGAVGGGADEETYDYKEDDVSAVNRESFEKDNFIGEEDNKFLKQMELAVKNDWHISEADAIKVNELATGMTELAQKVNKSITREVSEEL